MGRWELKLMTHSTMQHWILGLNFFENYYTIFDCEKRSIGLARSVHSKVKVENVVENIKDLASMISVTKSKDINKIFNIYEAAPAAIIIAAGVAFTLFMKKGSFKRV